MIGRFRPGTMALNACAWSPDGQRLAVAGDDNAVWLLDRQGTLLWRGEGHESSIWCLAFSPASGTRGRGGGRAWLASGSADHSIRLWDPETGAELARLGGHQGTVVSLAYAADGEAGHRLVSGSADSNIRVWDPDSGRELRCRTGHTNWVRSVAFAPDGRTLASGSWDHSVRLWDSHTGAELACLTGHGTEDRQGVWCVAFAPDGTLASVADDGQLVLWYVADLLHPFPRPGAGRVGGGDALGRWLARQAATVGRGAGPEDPEGPEAPPWVPDLWVPGGLPNDGVAGCLGVLPPQAPQNTAVVALSPDGQRLRCAGPNPPPLGPQHRCRTRPPPRPRALPLAPRLVPGRRLPGLRQRRRYRPPLGHPRQRRPRPAGAPNPGPRPPAAPAPG